MSTEIMQTDNIIDYDDFNFENILATTTVLLVEKLTQSKYYYIASIGYTFSWVNLDETYQLKVELYDNIALAWKQVKLIDILQLFEETIDTIKYIQVSDRFWFDKDNYTQIKVSLILGGTNPNIGKFKCNLTTR